ncbi:preprotein translocase subunit SecE [Mycoplasma sp. 480]|uniref:preprotein translocase subunit SecE n=1 Tax=Mycoplasma sp. 480 TaxID=3440155 RepID=UPI003F5133D2
MKEKRNKKKREKKYYFRNWIKEIKRIKWPKGKDANKNFMWTIIFVVVCSILFVSISFVATLIWNSIGVGF